MSLENDNVNLANMVRKLERENAELRKDRERLDWLLPCYLMRQEGDTEWKFYMRREDLDRAMELNTN